VLTLEMAPNAAAEAREHLTAERVNELILVHLPLAVGMARKFCRRREVPNPDDYIGVAGLATVSAIHNALKYLVDLVDLQKYVATYVRKRLMAYWQEDRVVATPSRRQQEFFALGYLTPVEVRPLSEDDMQHCWDSRIMEDLIEVCPDEFTRKVAHLRIEGYSDSEIVVLLNSSRMTVWRARQTLKKLLKEVVTGEEDAEPQFE
jgi:DNA-directed RNA polymerase specialized sigma24 family protein